VPAALTLLLLLGWALSRQPWFWSVAVIGIILIPALSATILELCRKPEEVLPRQHCAATAQSFARHLAQAALTLACLPYEAWFSLDAIVRTNWRIVVSGKRLLQWSPSHESSRECGRCQRSGLLAACRSMWIGPVKLSRAASP